MFKKNPQQQQPLEINQKEISTIVGEGYTFTGEIIGKTVIRIEGKIIGNVRVAAGVILGEKGIVEGDIFTQSAIIYGRVNGNVKTTQLEIKKTGFIKGEIITDTLEMELGAKYNGKLNMQANEEESNEVTDEEVLEAAS